MALIVLATVFILAIAFFQTIEGVFNALIMTILTILSAAIAFNYYEPMAAWLGELMAEQHAGYFQPVSLMGIFILTLGVLRILADMFIRSNVTLGMWPDRIAGGALGIVSGMVIVGMLTVSMQLMPFEASILTFKPFNDALERESGIAPFYPDQFTVALMETVSAGSLAAGPNSGFERRHDNLLREAHAYRNRAELHGRVYAQSDDLLQLQAWEAPAQAAPLLDLPENPLIDPPGATKDYVVRFTLDNDVRDDVPADQEDKNERFRLPATHFRLVTQGGESYYPLAYLTQGTGGWEAHAAPREQEQTALADLAVVRPYVDKEVTPSLSVDWVYRIPADQEPSYVEFRRVAKQEIPSPLVVSMPPAQDALDRAGELERSTGRRR